MHIHTCIIIYVDTHKQYIYACVGIHTGNLHVDTYTYMYKQYIMYVSIYVYTHKYIHVYMYVM